ncbi:MAG: hydroxymethylbilane synthase [Verrucomicrobia bacterium]|nr:hydroxymethylbilane synthase [Verrucomicrobiota bacterium]
MALNRPIRIATRGSPLALAQARQVESDLRRAFPAGRFELEVIRTTGDALQALDPADPARPPSDKGLFTKELEEALLDGRADLAVHSLKDLPTELPGGLVLAAVCPRADVREVLLYRDGRRVSAERNPVAEWRPGAKERSGFGHALGLADLPPASVVATGSARRAALVRAQRPDLSVVPIRGNVGTRLSRLLEDDGIDATLLAAAGLCRLGYDLGPKGALRLDHRLAPARRAVTEPPPEGILGTILEPEEFLPAVGQGAVALEIRAGDGEIAPLVAVLDHVNTRQAVLAERAFLRAMGGGCGSPIAGHARVVGHLLRLRVAVFRDGSGRFGEDQAPVREAEGLGRRLAERMLGQAAHLIPDAHG